MRSLLVGLIALAACTDSPGPSLEGTLSGTITGSGLGPLADVTLMITPTGSQTTVTAVTGTGGSYMLQIVEGRFR
jgi:hypothetical protein